MALQNRAYELFAQDYAVHGNCRRAAQAIGRRPATGSAILARPEVRARVDQLADDAFSAANINAVRVVKELARLAFADMRGLYDEHGNLLPVHELDDDTAASISQIKVEIEGRGKGEERELVVVKQIKQGDKLGALTVLAKHFKVIGDDGDGINAFANALADRLNTAKRRDNAAAEDAVERAARTPSAAAINASGTLTYAMPGDPSNAGDVTNRRLELAKRDPEALHFDLPGPTEVAFDSKSSGSELSEPPSSQSPSSGPGFTIRPAGLAESQSSTIGDDDEIW